MTTYIIIPGENAAAYRRKYGDFSALDPIKLHERDAFALPIAVLDRSVFVESRTALGRIVREELTVEDFEWWHEAEAERTRTR